MISDDLTTSAAPRRNQLFGKGLNRRDAEKID